MAVNKHRGVPQPGNCAYFDRSYERLYDARLMSGSLPEMIDPIQLADQGIRLTGELPADTMRRLAGSCLDAAGTVSVDLRFTRTAGGLRALRGRVAARLGFTCQRCLERMEQEVVAEPVLFLFRPGEAQAGVPDEAEALVVEPSVVLAEFVEDELLLALPMMPRHPAGTCGTSASRGRGQGEAPAESARPNPFASLEKFRRRD